MIILCVTAKNRVSAGFELVTSLCDSNLTLAASATVLKPGAQNPAAALLRASINFHEHQDPNADKVCVFISFYPYLNPNKPILTSHPIPNSRLCRSFG